LSALTREVVKLEGRNLRSEPWDMRRVAPEEFLEGTDAGGDQDYRRIAI
jgi:hypothetical protein